MATIINKFKKVKCPNCGKLIYPEVINEKAHIIICPSCLKKVSG